MKIAIDTRLLRTNSHSGVEEYTENIIKEFLKYYPQHQFIFFHNGLKTKKLLNLKTINWHIPNKILDIAFRFNLVQPNLGADIFFSPNLSNIKTTIPHIATIHDLSFMHYQEFFTPLARAWHLNRAKLQAKTATHIITDSEFTKNDLITLLKIKPEKISVIPLGIDSQFQKLPPQDARLNEFKNQHNLNFPFILYLGTLEPRKNIPALIRAWNILKQKNCFKDLRLVLAGKNGWLYQSIFKEAAISPFKNQIIFFGPVETKDRILLYNLSIALIYPSFFEGFGLPPLEAQACGTPVISSDRASLKEILGPSALLINPWKINAIAEAIESALTLKNTRENLIIEGLENTKKYSWKNTAKATMNVFEKYK